MAQHLLKRPPSTAPSPSFAISETEDGQWLARERHGAAVRVFPTRKAAIHFALFDLGDRHAAALLTPSGVRPRHRHGY